jgi:hypothetical protein
MTRILFSDIIRSHGRGGCRDIRRRHRSVADAGAEHADEKRATRVQGGQPPRPLNPHSQPTTAPPPPPRAPLPTSSAAGMMVSPGRNAHRRRHRQHHRRRDSHMTMKLRTPPLLTSRYSDLHLSACVYIARHPRIMRLGMPSSL